MASSISVSTSPVVVGARRSTVRPLVTTARSVLATETASVFTLYWPSPSGPLTGLGLGASALLVISCMRPSRTPYSCSPATKDTGSISRGIASTETTWLFGSASGTRSVCWLTLITTPLIPMPDCFSV